MPSWPQIGLYFSIYITKIIYIIEGTVVKGVRR